MVRNHFRSMIIGTCKWVPKRWHLQIALLTFFITKRPWKNIDSQSSKNRMDLAFNADKTDLNLRSQRACEVLIWFPDWNVWSGDALTRSRSEVPPKVKLNIKTFDVTVNDGFCPRIHNKNVKALASSCSHVVLDVCAVVLSARDNLF